MVVAAAAIVFSSLLDIDADGVAGGADGDGLPGLRGASVGAAPVRCPSGVGHCARALFWDARGAGCACTGVRCGVGVLEQLGWHLLQARSVSLAAAAHRGRAFTLPTSRGIRA
ncbi:hypothetical protein [Rhodococcus koreensis]